MATTARSRWSRTLVVGWILVLALTAGFQFYRGAPVDGIVFAVVAALLTADALGAFRRLSVGTWHPPTTILLIIVAGTAAVLALEPRHGIEDTIAMIVAGILVAVMSWPNNPARSNQTPPRWTKRMTRTAALWSAVLIAICLWELAMYFLGAYAPGGRFAYPALSDLLDPLLMNPIGRILFVAAWLLGGVALVHREWRR